MASFKEILSHGKNYLIANLATKALAFISIPVYTNLLTTNDYGMVNIFMGVAGILGNILTLCTDQSVSRYFFDKKSDDDFKRFVGTSTVIAVVVFICNSFLLLSLIKPFARLTGLDLNLVYLLIPFTLINIIALTYEQMYGPMKESKKIAISALSRAYLGFIFSVILIYYFDENKYLGQILGLIIAGSIMSVFWIKGIRKYFIFSFDKKYLRYIFTFSVPLIPYALSGVIIEQFGKIAIGSYQNVSQAGFYSLALTISGLVGIITAVTHQAWVPYYFEYMNSKDYQSHDRDIDRIFRITLISAMGIASFGKEIGYILANKDFTSSLYLIPILTYGFVFHQFAYVYMRNFSFVHKTFYSSVVVISAGVINVLLNLYVIPKFGEVGAAISFSFSYFCMAIFAWGINYFLLKVHSISIIKLFKPLSIYILFCLPYFFIDYLESYVLILIVKILLFLSFTTVIFWSNRTFFLNTIEKFNPFKG